ncbi:MFS transporter [Chlamydiifrater volucris]|uniref:MFS transporter n=1 Tax=Chlamydiifrater volucris TaxID=2681470 RepID=UPI0032B1188B
MKTSREISFKSLVITHFLTVLNDNLYKFLLVFFLVKDKSPQESTKVLSIVSLCFALPFLLLAPFAGSLADRFRKRNIILLTRAVEVFCTCLGTFLFYIQSEWGGYFVLVPMASHTAVFGPAKLGILPEILPVEQLSRANGIMTAATYSASILGSCLASVFCGITGGSGAEKYVFISSFTVIFSLVGAIMAFYISRSRVENKNQKIQVFNFKEIWVTLRSTVHIRYLTSAIFLGSFFLLIGAYVQLEIVPFVQFDLGLPEHYGGYLFPMVAIGVGLGSYLAGLVSGRNIELAYTPLAGVGIGGFLAGLHFSPTIFSLVLCLFFLGIFGGFYQVPLHAYVQYVSPEHKRGRILAANNFLDFFGVLLTSLVIWVLGNVLQLDPGKSFSLIGWAVALLSLGYLFFWRENLYRLLCDIFLQHHFIKHFRLHASPKSCFFCCVDNEKELNKVVALLPRVTRVIPVVFKKDFSLRMFSFCFSVVRANLSDEDSDTSLNGALCQTVNAVREGLERGESVCVLCIGGEEASAAVKILDSLLKENDLSHQKVVFKRNGNGKFFLDSDIRF